MNLYSTRPLSLALSRGHAIFLDLRADRYFALPIELNQLLLDLLHGGDVSRDAHEHLAAAVGVGVNRDLLLSMLVTTSIAPARSETGARPTLVDWRDRRDSTIERATASFFLRLFGLRRSLERVARTRPRRGPRIDELGRITCAQRWLDQHVTAADACLTRSIALTRCALAKGCDAKLVIGVKADPFEAHCWTQAGDCVLNDEIDRVAPFTPIVVLP